MSIKPLDALASSHERALTRPRHSTWFEVDEDGEDDEITAQVAVLGALSHPPIILSPEAPLTLVHAALRSGARAVIVVDGTRLCGAVTAASLISHDTAATARDALVPVVVLPAATALVRAAACFADSEIAVVTGAGGAIVGVATAHDVLRALT